MEDNHATMRLLEEHARDLEMRSKMDQRRITRLKERIAELDLLLTVYNIPVPNQEK